VAPKELKLMKISKGVVEGVYGNDYTYKNVRGKKD